MYILNKVIFIISTLTGVISLATFLYVTVGGRVIKKTVRLRSIQVKPVTFKVQLRNYNVQQITNIVSARYFGGGNVPPHVRKEIIALTAPTGMKDFGPSPHSVSGNPVFVNLTNHPSDKWDEAQVKAAQAYGDIVDLPFPNIDPDADAKEIKDMAEEYCQKVIEAAKDREPIVLLMGEMNFTYALLKRLRSQSITCLATTTQRITTDLPDGTKQSTFKFVKFRLYE